MSKFGDAFKAARAAGKKTFEFNGKSYHTKTKDETGAKSGAVKGTPPKPKANPSRKPAPKLSPGTKIMRSISNSAQAATAATDSNTPKKPVRKPVFVSQTEKNRRAAEKGTPEPKLSLGTKIMRSLKGGGSNKGSSSVTARRAARGKKK